MKKEVAIGLVAAGMLLILAALVVPVITGSISGDLFRYLYAAGALLLIAGRLISPSDNENIRIKRLRRIEGWSAIFFCVAAFLLFYDKTQMRDAVAFTLAGALIQIYTSIMIPRIQKGLE